MLGMAGAVFVLVVISASCTKTEAPAPQPPPKPLKQGLPPFKVGAQLQTSMTLVVDQDTPREGLRLLLLAFRTAREQGRFGELIPPTTPKGNAGPYAIVNVYVMGDPTWADEEHLRKALDSGVGDDFTWSFDRRTLATYSMSRFGGLSELAGLGANGGKNQ